MNWGSYWVARRIASDLDRKNGTAPNFLQILIGIGGLAMLGAIGCVVLIIVLVVTNSFIG